MTQDDCSKTSKDAPYLHRMSPEELAQPEWRRRCNPKTWSQERRDSLAKTLWALRDPESRGVLLVRARES